MIDKTYVNIKNKYDADKLNEFNEITTLIPSNDTSSSVLKEKIEKYLESSDIIKGIGRIMESKLNMESKDVDLVIKKLPIIHRSI